MPKMEHEYLQVRLAGARDVSSIAWNNMAIANETEGKALDPHRAAEGVKGLLSDPARGFYLLAEQGDCIVGQCMVTYEWSDWRNGNFWWIQSVYVKEECRRKGVFATLFRSLESMAHTTPGVVGFRLYVDRKNQTAREVYEHLGMKETEYRLFETEFLNDHD